MTTMKRPRRRDELNLTKRQRHVLFLQGALDAAMKTVGRAPAHTSAFQEYMLGMTLVDRGTIVIRDAAAMERHIADVRDGRWPARSAA